MFSKNIFFLAFLYFVQGLPYGLQTWFLPVFFRSRGMSLSNVGFFKLLLTPWMFKALWAPLVDHYGTKRTWLTWSMLGLALTCLIGSLCRPTLLTQLAVILFLFNLLTSTQDIAVDGLAIQILTMSELANGNSAQVVGYKIGAVVGGGLLTWLSDYLDWMFLFQCLAAVYLLAVAIAWKYLPTVSPVSTEIIVDPDSDKTEKQNKQSEKSTDHTIHQKATYEQKSENDGLFSWILNHFRIIARTEGTAWIAIYVILYKLGEKGSLSMVPLFLLDQGIPTAQVGFWTGIVGQAVSIGGSVLGGFTIYKSGQSTLQLLKSLSVVRTVVLAGLCFLISTWTPSQQSFSTAAIIALMLVILLISGYITTATFTLMMECSQRAPVSVQASHYTTLATLEVLGKLSFSVVTGLITDMTSYSTVFVLFTVLSGLIIPVFKFAPPVLVQSNTHRRNKSR